MNGWIIYANEAAMQPEQDEIYGKALNAKRIPPGSAKWAEIRRHPDNDQVALRVENRVYDLFGLFESEVFCLGKGFNELGFVHKQSLYKV